jgi:hypothetical protein
LEQLMQPGTCVKAEGSNQLTTTLSVLALQEKLQRQIDHFNRKKAAQSAVTRHQTMAMALSPIKGPG